MRSPRAFVTQTSGSSLRREKEVGLSVREIMGYCEIAFAVGFAVFGGALLIFPGAG